MKHQATVNIQSAIRRILDGGIYVSDEIHRLILDRIRSGVFESGIADPVACLTNREFEVMRLIGFGFGTRQIASSIHRFGNLDNAYRTNHIKAP